ncbi:MAG: hypothetical protein K0S88_4548 [Actinomycetia bacterium]|jgi:hypothetical protein|nr:hypothetical protein [Actinomycetes bacterium]
MRVPVPARLLLAALACLVVAACGGGSGDDTTGAAATTTVAAGTTAAASPACADAAALKASVAELDQLDPPQAGKTGTLAALQKVRDSLTALKASAGTQWGAQVTELDAAIDGFQTTVAGVDGDSLLGDLPAIVGDLERIDTAWTALEGEIDRTCG